MAQAVSAAYKMLGTEWAPDRSLTMCPVLDLALSLMEGGRGCLWLCFCCLCHLMLFLESLLILFLRPLLLEAGVAVSNIPVQGSGGDPRARIAQMGPQSAWWTWQRVLGVKLAFDVGEVCRVTFRPDSLYKSQGPHGDGTGKGTVVFLGVPLCPRPCIAGPIHWLQE